MIRLIATLLLLVAPAAAWAEDCGAGSIDARQIGTDDYDPNDLSQSVVRVSLRLTEECELRDLRVVPRDSNVFRLTSAGETLQSIQSDDPQITVRNISEFELKQRVAMQLKRGEEVIFDLLDLAPGQYVRSGTYQATIDFVAGNRNLGTLLLNVIVSPTVRLFGAADGGNIDLDLGRLNDGASAQQSIYFRSNAQVSLLVTSDNGGRLVHERGTQFGTIEYQALLNGAPINTVSPAVVPLGGFSGQLTEVRLGVEIPPVRVAFAGIYRDVITVSFTAL